MDIGIPQIIYIILVCLNCGMVISKHGQPKTGAWGYHDWLIGPGIGLGLLYWGGFFG